MPNVVSNIMQTLTPDIVNRIGSTIGLDSERTQSAIGAAVPGLLAGLSHVAITPGGAQRLADAAAQQNGILGNFTGMLSNGGQPQLIEKGSMVYSKLLGAQDAPLLSSAVGNYAGVSQGKTINLLGMLTPVVMGAIVKEQTGLPDGRGIASFLATQKDAILNALPAGFGKLLMGVGLLDGISHVANSTARGATFAASTARRTASDAGYRAGSTATTAPMPMQKTAQRGGQWYYWPLIALVVASLLVLWMLNSRPSPAPALPISMIAGNLDIRKELNDSMASLRTTLVQVNDAATAETALPQLQAIGGQIDHIASMRGVMTRDQLSAMAGMVTPDLPTLRRLTGDALAKPGVAGVLRPTLDSLLIKLTGLTT